MVKRFHQLLGRAKSPKSISFSCSSGSSGDALVDYLRRWGQVEARVFKTHPELSAHWDLSAVTPRRGTLSQGMGGKMMG